MEPLSDTNHLLLVARSLASATFDNTSSEEMDKVESEDKCHLLSGTFGMAVQMSLGVFSLLALFIKWRNEKNRRSLLIWKYDVLKQVIASLFAHVMNLVIAIILAEGGNENAECPWYFVNFVFDTFCGIPLAAMILHILQCIAGCCGWERVKETGYYGTPPQFKWFIAQVMMWTLVMLLTKTSLAIPLYIHRVWFSEFAEWLFEPVRQEPKVELIIVMIVVPGLLNTLNFCLFDTLLKRRQSTFGKQADFQPLNEADSARGSNIEMENNISMEEQNALVI